MKRRGYQLHLTDSALAKQIFANIKYRESGENLLARLLRKGDTYVDVGANIGNLAIFANKSIGCKVFAIEPHPKTFKNLESNILLNNSNDIFPLNIACGEKEGVVNFTDTRSDDQNKISHHGRISVPCKTLDELIPEDIRIRLLKIDVEGFELFTLRGSKRVLTQCDAIVFESYNTAYSNYGYSTKDVIDLLHEAGFSAWRIKGPDIFPFDDPAGSPVCEDLLALPHGERI